MYAKSRIYLAVSAGLAAAVPTVVQADCPAAQFGTVIVDQTINASVNGLLDAVCNLSAGESIAVAPTGTLDVTVGADGGRAIDVTNEVEAGFIEINGRVELEASDVSWSGRADGVLVSDGAQVSSVDVAGTIAVQSQVSANGLLIAGTVTNDIDISGSVSVEPVTAPLANSRLLFGLELIGDAWNVPITITETGRVSGYSAGIRFTDGTNATPLGSFTNNGIVGEPLATGVGGGASMERFDFNAFTNTNVIRAVNELDMPDVRSGQLRDGLDVNDGSFIRNLTNEGTITAINGGNGLHLSHQDSQVDTLTNKTEAVISASSEPGNNETGSGIRLGRGATISTLRNEGSISGSAHGLELNDESKYLAVITELINLGTIEGDVHDIVSPPRDLSNSPPIGTLVNAQSGLTFTGRLPSEYVIYARSPSEYGSLSATNVSGAMTFKLSSEDFEATVANNTLYPGVLVGVSDENLTSGSFSGVTDGLAWSLVSDESDPSTWDLCVGECDAPSAIPVPVASPWGLGLLGGLLGLWGFLGLRRRAVS